MASTNAPLLLVAATPLEAAWLLQQAPFAPLGSNHWAGEHEGQPLELLCTGIGQANTAFAVGRRLAQGPVLGMVNLGIAGSYSEKLALEQVVELTTDCFADLGAQEADGQLLDLEALGFALVEQPTTYNTLHNPHPSTLPIPKVHGLTYNTAGGEQKDIARRRARWPEGQVETLESAAVFLAGLRSSTPFMAFRSISNYVTTRDRSSWRIAQAAQAVQAFVWRQLPAIPAHFQAS